jgi:hypothetical protein
MVYAPIALPVLLTAPYIRLFVFIASLTDTFVANTFLCTRTILSLYASYTVAFKTSPIASVLVTKSVWIIIVATNLLYTFMFYTFKSFRKAIFWTFAFPFLWYASGTTTNLPVFALMVKLAFYTVP